jgi:hypothetical protein
MRMVACVLCCAAVFAWDDVAAQSPVDARATVVSSSGSPFREGTKIIGGTAGFNYIDGDRYEAGGAYARVFLYPRFLTFISQGRAIGGTLSLDRYGTDRYKQTNLGIGPEFAYYFESGSSIAYPFVSFRGLLRLLWRSSEVFDGYGASYRISSNGKGYSLGIRGGYVIFITGSVALDLSAGGTLRGEKWDDDWGASDWVNDHQILVELGLESFIR